MESSRNRGRSLRLIVNVIVLSACSSTAHVRGRLKRGLPFAAIRQVAQRHQGSIERCYEGAVAAYEAAPLIDKSKMTGTVTLAWTITPEGTVSNLSVVSSTVPSGRLAACLRMTIRLWTFPTSDAPTKVESYAFAFGPRPTP